MGSTLELPDGWQQTPSTVREFPRDVILTDPDGGHHIVGYSRSGWIANSPLMPPPTRPRLHATAQSAADEIVEVVVAYRERWSS